jgi:integrase
MERQVAFGQLSPRTRETLAERLAPVRKRIGRRPVQKITADTVSDLASSFGVRGYGACRRALSFAVRRGYIASNPAIALERSERPKPKRLEVRVLSADELRALTDAAVRRAR